MASYSYTRDLKEEDLAQPEAHVYTKKELWENWWDYNLRWVIVGVIAAGILIYLLLDVLVFTADVDYQLAIVSPTSISESILTEMEETLSAQLEDVSGDGVVTVEVYSYMVDLSTYDTVTAVTGETEEVVEEPAEEDVATDEDGYATYDYADTSEYDYYLEMAGQVQLSADLELGETTIFILSDPQSFQIASGALCSPDGTMPEDGADAAWETLVYDIADCTFFSDTVLEALDGYYIARRNSETDDTVIEHFAFYQSIWDMIIGDAVPVSEKVA